MYSGLGAAMSSKRVFSMGSSFNVVIFASYTVNAKFVCSYANTYEFILGVKGLRTVTKTMVLSKQNTYFQNQSEIIF
eukprot:snap_masked-scaffold_15-processed-gene-3.4-mRNA-1 protein AED:1.00 eAED:1.00 QI:0/0/0/0/1/1/2/0/76